MKSLDTLLRKKFRAEVAVADPNLFSSTTGESSRMAFSEIEPLSDFRNNCLDMHKSKNKASNFLNVYFDFAYYTGCCPFHFKKDQNDWYTIKTWKPQQISCALLHAIGILRLITEVRGVIPLTIRQTPEDYFAIIGGVFRLLFKVVTMKRLWCNQKHFLDIINFMTVEKSLPDCHLKIQNKHIISFLCGICFVMPMVVALKCNIIAASSTCNSSWWNRRLLVDGRFSFFLISKTDYKSNDTSVFTDDENISVFDYFLVLLMGVGLIVRLIIGFYFDISLLFGVLTLWTTAYAFSSAVIKVSGCHEQFSLTLSAARQRSGKECMMVETTSVKTENWLRIYDAFKAVRTLSRIINNAFGSMITTFLAESILYHSMNMDAVILTKDAFKQAYLIYFIISSSTTYLYAADICNQMDSLKVWLSKDENRKFIPLDELNMVLHELQTMAVGIRGNNIFTITYSLVWNMLTTVVTYFIICMQARTYSNSGS